MKNLSLLIVLACALAMTGCAGGLKTGKPVRDGASGHIAGSYQEQKKSIAEQSAKTKAAMSAYTTKTTPVGNDTFLISDSEASNATKKATLSSTRAALGLGTADNPSFASVHASGGNLAAANKQVTKAWQTGLSYTADVTSVIHGGKHWIAKTTHTAGSTTEPGVGASYADAWTEVSGAGDDLGSAAYSDVVALWTTCTGYLKSDGTCDTPSGSMTYPGAGIPNSTGSAWGTSYTVGTGANNLVQLNGSSQLPAVSAALLTNFPTLNQNTTGNAATASALAANPTDCSAGQYATTIAANGNLTCAQVGYSQVSGTPTLGTSAQYNVGTGANNIVQLNASGELPFTLDVGDLTDTGNLLGGGGASELNDLTDVTISGTPTTGQILKFNGTVWAPGSDATAEGAGYVSTPPTYSDEACTAGQYALSESYRFDCVASGNWNRTALTDWSNPAPDTTPNAFSFVDQTDVATSTEITSAPVQITGISAATAVSASGGTAGICTSTDIGDCGTFGTSPGNITNEQYVRARHTSSSNAETAVNTVVTVGGVSDTFTSTTKSSVTAGYIGIYQADPTGSTNTSTVSGQGSALGSPFVTTTAGYVNRVCFAAQDGSYTINPAIYSSDKSTKLAEGNITSTSNGAWKCASLDTPLLLEESTTYFLSMGVSEYVAYYRKSASGQTSFRNISIGGALSNTMPSSITGGTENANYQVWIYADYQ